MMTTEQRAFEIMYDTFGGSRGRDVFRAEITDLEKGRWLRRFKDAIEIGIVKDRAAIASQGRPS